jgi:hypothetical protein
MHDKRSEKTDQILPVAPGWPKPLGKAAMYGLLGDIVGTIGPHTEADPAAVASQTLVAFGNVIGKKPHFKVEADRHSANVFTCLVGRSARSRKGTSRGYALKMFSDVDREWVKKCIQTGLSSGEGLVQAVAENTLDDDELGKRLMVIEDEFSAPLRVMSRYGNTLSTTLRNTWDGRTLQVMTRGDPLRAPDAHISIVAHTTQHDLNRYLNQTDLFNGFANRFLFLSVQRSKLLPNGGGIPEKEMSLLAKHLKESVKFAKRQREISLSRNAASLWEQKYPQLTADIPGLVGEVTSRAEAQVRRLALIYALMNQSRKVRTNHLLAALEFWRYCNESAHFIFGGRSPVTVQDKILEVLRWTSKGFTRTEISEALQRHVSSAAITQALHELRERGLARTKTLHTSGRSAELWLAVQEDES